jgi:putative peptidoglycan lipid II flippase
MPSREIGAGKPAAPVPAPAGDDSALPGAAVGSATGWGAGAPTPGGVARAVGRASVIVSVATLASRVLGLLRETTLADRFAATHLTDAYNVAALIPLVLFAAVGVAITTAFIPLFSEVLSGRGPREAERFAANANGAVTLAIGVLILLLELGAGPIVHTLLGGWSAGQQDLCIRLVRITSPLILFYGWSAIAGGVLNVRGVFGPRAAMGIPQNLTIIAAILLASAGGRQNIALVAWGGLAGTATTFLVQLPALRRCGFRVGWRLDLHDPLLRRMLRRVGPAALTALSQQTGSLVVYVLGSRLPSGMITDFVYASRLQLLAYSILGMSVATVLYPRLAALRAEGDMRAFRRTFVRGLGLVSAVTVPMALGLFLLRMPAVQVVYQHGRFTAADTATTAVPLAFLSLGTIAYAWQDYINRTFYALGNTRTPMTAALIGTGLGIALAAALYRPLGLAGLGLAMAAGWSAALVYLVVRLRGALGLLGGRRIAGSVGRLLVAAAVGFGPASVAVGPVARHFGGGWVVTGAALAACGLGGAVVYGALAAALRVPEVGAALEMFRGSWRRLRHAT